MSLAATIVWEIRTDGSDANGGGWKSNAGTTDYSQQAAAQLTVADGATAGIGNTTLTSATGGFTAAMVGSIVHLYTGTNLTDGWYEITAYTDTNTVTLDRAPDDGVGGVSSADVKVGGALASVGGLGAVFQVAAQATAGMKGYVRGGTYNLGSTTVNVSTGPLDLDASQMDGKKFYLKGYDAAQSRDSFAGTRPIINCNGNTPANATVIESKGGLDNSHFIGFIKVDGDGLTVVCFRGNGLTVDVAYRCVATNTSSSYGGGGFFVLTCVSCSADNCYCGHLNSDCYNCISYTCTAQGFRNCKTVNCISYNNNSQGFFFYGNLCANCVSYGNASDGFRNENKYALCFINCVSYLDGGYAFNRSEHNVMQNCAHRNTASGRTSSTPNVDLNPITLTADPFTNAAGLDFSLNDAAGGGALLRAAGISPYGQTGYPDVGAVQHAYPTVPSAGQASEQATLAKETGANARGGSGTCAKLTPTSTTLYGYWDFYVPATASEQFTFSLYWKKSASAFNGLLKVSIWDTDHSTLKNDSEAVDITAADTNYHKYTATAVTPTATGMCRVRVELKNGASSGLLYIDDIEMA